MGSERLKISVMSVLGNKKGIDLNPLPGCPKNKLRVHTGDGWFICLRPDEIFIFYVENGRKPEEVIHTAPSHCLKACTLYQKPLIMDDFSI